MISPVYIRWYQSKSFLNCIDVLILENRAGVGFSPKASGMTVCYLAFSYLEGSHEIGVFLAIRQGNPGQVGPGIEADLQSIAAAG